MSLYPVRVKQDSVQGGTYNPRQKASSLWRNVTERGSFGSYELGSRDGEDFHSVTSATSGSEWIRADIGTVTPSAFVQVAKDHGVARLSTGATTFAEGIQVLRAVPASTVAIRGGATVVFEASIDVETGAAGTGTAPNFFCGLFNATGTSDGILTVTTGAISTAKSYIGFVRNTSASGTLGNLLFSSRLQGTGVSTVTVLTAAEVATLVAANGGKLNLGFRVNGRTSVEIYVNGEYYKTASEAVSSANLPAATEYLTFGMSVLDFITASALGSVSLECDWYETYVSP